MLANYPRNNQNGKTLLLLFTLSFFLISCDDDENNPTMPKESATFKVTIENIGHDFMFSSNGVFNTLTGESFPGQLLPGSKYEFEFDAASGYKLSFVSMMVQSYDLFI